MLKNRTTRNILALMAFVAIGVFMPGSEPSTRQLSAESDRRLAANQVCTPVYLDWEQYPDGTPIKKGDYIKNEFMDAYGLQIKGQGKGGSGFTPNNKVRVFDTSDVAGSGDEDLGTPNEGCPNPGPGVSEHHKAEAVRTNCVPLHNVLIIQEQDQEIPDDNARGGTITLTFDEPVSRFNEVGLMDMERLAGNGDYVEVTYGGGLVQRFDYTGLGDNTVQSVDTGSVSDVTKVRIVFRTSGAVPWVRFTQCVDGTEAPVTPAPVTSAPITPAPITPAPVPATPAPITIAQTPAPAGGVNGDPLIMGLAGQLFKFDGRSGAWYSAVSTPSFQWNMKIQEYDECPTDSNKFVSGVGFTLYKKSKFGRTPAHKIVVNVVNEFGVQMGCGTGDINCLGNGSLELIIDDEKYVYPGDYQLKDRSGRIIAFNTFYECARKWYDFDITPADEENSSLRASRRLQTFPGVFDVVRDLEGTMVNKDACDSWISERQRNNDLFHQPGEWSTIIVKTNTISFHIEYKQEHKRCSAHTIDVWISSVSPELYDEEWEGVIGETKDPSNHGEEKIERSEFLKFPDDAAYEVISPFSDKCMGCYKH